MKGTKMKKAVMVIGSVLFAGVVFAQQNMVFGLLEGNEIRAKKIILDGVTQSGAKATTGVTNVTAQTATLTGSVTKQTAAITASATVQGVTLQLKGIDDSTNDVVNVTNVVVTISNGGAVVTNLSVSVAGVATNVSVSR